MKKNKIIIAVLAFVAGMLVSSIFHSRTSPASRQISPPVAIPSVDAVTSMAEIDKVDKATGKKIDSIKKIEAILSQKQSAVKSELTNLQQRNKQLAAQLQSLARNKHSTTAIDSAASDSLKTASLAFVKNDLLKDSLFTAIESAYVQQLQLKESVISLKDQQMIQLRLGLINSVMREQSALIQLHTLQKDFKRQKIRNRLITIAALIVTGFAAHHMITH